MNASLEKENYFFFHYINYKVKNTARERESEKVGEWEREERKIYWKEKEGEQVKLKNNREVSHI